MQSSSRTRARHGGAAARSSAIVTGGHGLKLMAHRTVQTCIDTLSGGMGVSGEVQLWYSTCAESFRQASMEELAVIANGVVDWRGLERESLDRLVLPEPAAVSDKAVPLPEPLDAGDGAASEAFKGEA
jgi:hypothetical protein